MQLSSSQVTSLQTSLSPLFKQMESEVIELQKNFDPNQFDDISTNLKIIEDIEHLTSSYFSKALTIFTEITGSSSEEDFKNFFLSQSKI